MTGARDGGEPERSGLGRRCLRRIPPRLRAYARALYRAGASDAANRAEGFEVAQWALQNDAADALSAMAARFAKGGQELGKLVREQQDLLGAREAAYRSLDAAAGKADAKAAEAARAAIARDRGQACGEAGRAAPGLPRLRRAGQSEAASARGRASAARRRGCPGAVSRSLANGRGARRDDCLRAHKERRLAGQASAWALSALRERVAALRCGLDSRSLAR